MHWITQVHVVYLDEATERDVASTCTCCVNPRALTFCQVLFFTKKVNERSHVRRLDQASLNIISRMAVKICLKALANIVFCLIQKSRRMG
ncbi:unnamed protein product [Cylicocyclus nassatus]|uniref:Uncharacterized protein n=1 Tax=Cylicocyclus nassatus TaxID=53992 RepID=A0AA36M3Y7_CYLNA|nr:unnamed protein product [Cylicocyclus nassatus]